MVVVACEESAAQGRGTRARGRGASAGQGIGAGIGELGRGAQVLGRCSAALGTSPPNHTAPGPSFPFAPHKSSTHPRTRSPILWLTWPHCTAGEGGSRGGTPVRLRARQAGAGLSAATPCSALLRISHTHTLYLSLCRPLSPPARPRLACGQKQPRGRPRPRAAVSPTISLRSPAAMTLAAACISSHCASHLREGGAPEWGQ